MEFQQLDPSYEYDVLASAMYMREVEYFHFACDVKNFDNILATVEPCAYTENIAQRREETLARMKEVDAIYFALKSQILDQAAFDAAVLRQKAKRDAAAAK